MPGMRDARFGQGISVKRLSKMIFSGLTIVSLLLCVATVVMWVRSGYAADIWTWGGAGREYWVRSDWGRFGVTSVGNATPRRTHETSSGGYHGVLPGPKTGEHEWAGVRFAWGRSMPGQIMGPTLRVTGRGMYWSAQVYHPILAVVLAWPLVPYCLVCRRRQTARKRLAAGLCCRCGYDLRASKEQCPECGSAVPAGHVPNIEP